MENALLKVARKKGSLSAQILDSFVRKTRMDRWANQRNRTLKRKKRRVANKVKT